MAITIVVSASYKDNSNVQSIPHPFKDEDIYVMTLFEGAVLWVDEQTTATLYLTRYAIVWNMELLQLERVPFGVKGPDGVLDINHAKVDATEKVQTMARGHLRTLLFQQWQRDALKDAMSVYKGRKARVVRGRKVPIGTEGEVVWWGEDKYRKGKYRVGLERGNGETVYLPEEYCEVINPEQYQKPLRDGALWAMAQESHPQKFMYNNNFVARHRLDEPKDILEQVADEIESEEKIAA